MKLEHKRPQKSQNFRTENADRKMITELDLRHLKIQCLWEAEGGVEAIKKNQAYLLCSRETQEVRHQMLLKVEMQGRHEIQIILFTKYPCLENSVT